MSSPTGTDRNLCALIAAKDQRQKVTDAAHSTAAPAIGLVEAFKKSRAEKQVAAPIGTLMRAVQTGIETRNKASKRSAV